MTAFAMQVNVGKKKLKIRDKFAEVEKSLPKK